MSVGRTRDRDSVLPGARRAGRTGKGNARPGRCARNHDVPAPRSWPGLYIRVPAAQFAGVEAAVRAVSPAVSRQLSPGAILARLCPPLARMVGAEAAR